MAQFDAGAAAAAVLGRAWAWSVPSRMKTVTRTPRPTASRSSGRMLRTRFKTHAHSQTELRAARISSSHVL
ncbi:hypothetical protein GCM10027073_36600 [Streptomyces chlorus]|uniref:Secreted protein n=1 Tax=Streptomyces chlorus TaxID=887452 RepID=A0ABW1DZQ0_9ACTN